MAKWFDAYDKNTGKKLPNKVPEHLFDIFSNLRKTPTNRAAEKATTKKEA